MWLCKCITVKTCLETVGQRVSDEYFAVRDGEFAVRNTVKGRKTKLFCLPTDTYDKCVRRRFIFSKAPPPRKLARKNDIDNIPFGQADKIIAFYRSRDDRPFSTDIIVILTSVIRFIGSLLIGG